MEGPFECVVIYDPNGGFVTGGGWIQSPPGAYVFVGRDHSMTTINKTFVGCRVCGKASPQFGIGSTGAYGYADLDSRPPEMRRSTIGCWVQRCPVCGCCAADLEAVSESAGTLVESAHYRVQLQDEDFPELANSFLCSAMLLEADDKYVEAAWASIHAAWACDDARAEASGTRSRDEAVRLVRLVREEGLALTDQPSSDPAILVDLLRRGGRFKEGVQEVDGALVHTDDETVRTLLRYQRSLLLKGDRGRYTVEAALGAGT